MAKIVIEQAKHSDYEEVMKISEGVYNGFDYLPYLYHKWISQEEEGVIPRKNFVWRSQSDGKIVGYNCLLKNGDWIISLAARIDPNLHGQNIFRHRVSAFYSFRDQYFPNEKMLKVLSMGYTGNIRQNIIDKYNNLLDIKALLPLQLKQGALERLELKEHKFQSLLWHEFKYMLLNNDIIRNLCCPRNVITLAYQPFGLHDNGLALESMLYGHPSIFIDAIERPCSVSVMQWPYPIPAGICLNMDIWSNGDITAAKKHFNAQMDRAIHILKETGNSEKSENSVIRAFIGVDLGLKLAVKEYIIKELNMAHEVAVSDDTKVSLGAAGNVQVVHLETKDLSPSKL